jgi:excisionase family DNA binding protein
MKAGTLQMAVTTGSVLGVKAGSSLLVPHSEIERLQKGKSVDGQPEPPEYESLREVLKRFVTVQEAAEMLGIKPLNVYVRISQGGILAIRAGTGTLISLTEIERLLAKKHKLPTTAPEPALEVKELQEVLKQFVLGSEAMKILNLKRSTLGSRIKSGHIASISAGETLLIARSELRRVQEAQKPKVYTAPECETLRDALKRFATTQEAAASLGITRSALRQLVLEGQLPYVSTGYEVLIPLSELSKYQQKSA